MRFSRPSLTAIALFGGLLVFSPSASADITLPNGKIVRGCLDGSECPYIGPIAAKGRRRAGTATIIASAKRVDTATFWLRKGTRDSGCSVITHTDYISGDYNRFTRRNDPPLPIKRNRFLRRWHGGPRGYAFDERFSGLVKNVPGAGSAITGTWSSRVTADSRSGKETCTSGGMRTYRAHPLKRRYAGTTSSGGWIDGYTDFNDSAYIPGSEIIPAGVFRGAYGVQLVRIPTTCVDADGSINPDTATFKPSFGKDILGERARTLTSTRLISTTGLGVASADVTLVFHVRFPGLLDPTGSITGDYNLTYVARDDDGALLATCATGPGTFNVPGVPIGSTGDERGLMDWVGWDGTTGSWSRSLPSW